MVDFVVIEIGGDERAPIIFGQPFLCTTKAIIYAEHAKIVFTIKDKKEKFSFKNHMLHSPTQPLAPNIEKESVLTKKKKNNRNWRKNKASHAQEEIVKMINIIRSEYDHLLTPPFLVKKDDPGVPTIECAINQRIFYKTFCDIGLGVNIMSKVTYEYLFGNELLYPTYMQLQMADQSIRFQKGHSKGHPSTNLRSLRSDQFHGPRHGSRRRRDPHYLGKTIPQHHQYHHLHWIWTSPLLVSRWKGTLSL
jgi:hypothetical protein